MSPSTAPSVVEVMLSMRLLSMRIWAATDDGTRCRSCPSPRRHDGCRAAVARGGLRLLLRGGESDAALARDERPRSALCDRSGARADGGHARAPGTERPVRGA